MRKLLLITGLALGVVVPTRAQDATGAVGTFIDRSGTELGSVTLTASGASVLIRGEVMGLEPGEHGIHFHQTGDCDSSVGFESAGAHFNPTSHQHGLENPEGPHAGDLPNLTASVSGTAAIDLATDRVSLVEGDPAYVFDEDGTALVIHAMADDNVTDPSGNSGDRIACAVIEAQPAE
jgi:Cu-Zn family superoxide dismutase